jgi:hypothetical protein
MTTLGRSAATVGINRVVKQENRDRCSIDSDEAHRYEFLPLNSLRATTSETLWVFTLDDMKIRAGFSTVPREFSPQRPSPLFSLGSAFAR